MFTEILVAAQGFSAVDPYGFVALCVIGLALACVAMGNKRK